MWGGGSVIPCQIRLDKGRETLTGMTVLILGCDDLGSAASDDEEIQAFGEAIAKLMSDI
jgi:hypothetical protein